MAGSRSLLTLCTLTILLGTALAGTAAGSETYAEEPPEAEPANTDECSALRHDIDERIQAFTAELQAKRDAYYAEQHQRAEAFGAETHTEDEWAAFKQEQDAARQHFESGLRSEHEAFVKAKWDAYNSECGYHATEATADGAEPAPHDGVPAECQDKAEAIRQMMDEMGPRMQAAHEEFRAKQMALHEEFASDPRTQEEMLAFREAEGARFEAFRQGMEAELKAAFEGQGLLECFKLMQGRFDGPQIHDGARPAYADAKPMPAGGLHPELEGKVQAIMRECMAKVEDFAREHRPTDGQAYPAEPAYSDGQARPAPNGAPPPPPPEGATYEEDAYPAGTRYEGYDGSSPQPIMGEPAPEDRPYGMSPEIEAKIRAIMAECEERARALYQEQAQDAFGSFEMYFDEEAGEIHVQGKCVSMIGLPDEQMMTQIQVCGKLWIDALYATGFLAEFSPAQTKTGSAIEVRDEDGQKVLSVHDNKRGVINLAPTELSGAFVLDLADDLVLEETGKGYRCAGDGARCAILLHGAEATLGEGNVLTISSGKATFLAGGESDDAPELDAKVDDALLERKVGGQVKVRKGATDATPIGDLEIETEETEPADAAESPVFTATLESESGAPTTVTFDFDKEYFPGDELLVEIAGLNDDGTTSTLTVAKASSLEDVLDATDDEADAEWWVVQDENGWHLLASFSHWSAKELTVQSVDGDASGGLPVPGFTGAFLVAALGLALVGAGLRRRPE